MNNERPALTTKTGKAKCLAYRNGQRCGRVATYVMRGKSFCKECFEDEIICGHVRHNPKGFTVHERNLGGWVTRDYVEYE
jgi:hypothetical protein